MRRRKTSDKSAQDGGLLSSIVLTWYYLTGGPKFLTLDHVLHLEQRVSIGVREPSAFDGKRRLSPY